MSPAIVGEPCAPSWAESASKLEPYDGPPRNVKYIEDLKFDDSLSPKKYEIQGTHPDSKILILDVSILDSTGKEPYRGDVLIEGKTRHVHPISCTRYIFFSYRASLLM